jgi:hypothetical protein
VILLFLRFFSSGGAGEGSKTGANSGAKGLIRQNQKELRHQGTQSSSESSHSNYVHSNKVLSKSKRPR